MKTGSTPPTANSAARPVRALYLANPDGSPRWVWPEASRSPEFLSFYPASTWKQRLFHVVVRVIFLLRLQGYVFSVTTTEPVEGASGSDWAIFTGTVGPNRKQVIIRDARTVVKIAAGQASWGNLENEMAALCKLSQMDTVLPFRFPEVRAYAPGELTMERLPDHGTWSTLTPAHINALGALRASTTSRSPLHRWAQWSEVQGRLCMLEHGEHPAIPGALIEDLRDLVKSLDEEAIVHYAYAHGDFTPWNTLRTTGNRLGIIDWELANDAMPVGSDYFHFYLQKGIMVERQKWKAIYAAIHADLTPHVKEVVFGSVHADVDFYLRLYLLHHSTYYLSVYSRQERWHPQVYWQLDVWQEAIRSLLPRADRRRQLISSIFAQLNQGPYAVLKLGDARPEDLPTDSDFDILLPREQVNALIDRLAAYTSVDRVQAVRKSFMASLLIVLTDGQTLSLDLIWKLKRKATVFLDATGMIDRCRSNRHGICVVNDEDTERYLRLFYGLNGQPVPEKYGLEAGVVEVEPSEENRGLRGLANHLAYLADSLRTVFTNRGFVVTFSGVDGAGKSTVIGEVTTLIDKQLRRPVKVLRHRPSLMPILSAYVHGKEGAEQRSIERLPRTGTNRSFLSSLLRFSYYYVDYLLGQVYIYFRYVLRGYAVVYDRYYYDFMLDARRSNIELPPFITRWGMRLLIKPRYNFFLYADADTILARKQELDRPTIVRLTTSYRSLFDRCQLRHPTRVFRNIENIRLNDTLHTLSDTLKTSIK